MEKESVLKHLQAQKTKLDTKKLYAIMKNSQKATESLAVQTKMVLPNDTNPLNTLFGGRLLEWMDEIASISAHKHCGRVVVTASINNVSFDEPIFAGEIVITCKSK